MKVLAWLFAPMLAIALGVPIGAVAITATVVAPAVAEQIRIDPCSAYPDQTNVDVSGGEEAGVGFELPKWGTPRYQSLHSPAQPIPGRIKQLHVAAGGHYKVPWQLLAGIGMAETRHGRNNHTSTAGAQGLMQFMPATFAAYGVDGNRDGRRDIHNDADSIHSAANYLVHSGVRTGKAGVIRALWAYNRSVSDRNDVLFYAWSYAGRAGVVVDAGDPADCLPVTGDLPGFDRTCPPSHSAAEGGLRATALRGLRCVKAAFPAITRIGGRGPRPIATSDHPRGLAVDFMIPKWSTRAGNAFGWRVARWVQANAKALRVKYIIFDARKWVPTVSGSWRAYHHPLGASPTLAHRDHVHVSFYDH